MGEEIKGQIMMGDVAEMVREHEEKQYKAFTEKFKEAKTTDDCYTPQNVYDVLADWVAEEYGIPRERFMRPFRPGGDYQAEEYPEGCAVVDNPPFSILAQICGWYLDRGVRFFLFGPTLTLIGNLRGDRVDRLCVVLSGNQITYENGAVVNTSYITNMDERYTVRIEAELRRRMEEADKVNQRMLHKELPKYVYPDTVMTGGDYTLARWGQTLRIPRGECQFIRTLDAQKDAGKSVFGGGAAD